MYDDYIHDIDKQFHKYYGNLWLNEYQADILKKNGINALDFKDNKSLILYLENILNYIDNEELEELSLELSEIDYYQNVDK